MYTLIVVDYNTLEKTLEYTRMCRRFLGPEGGCHVVIVENGTPEREQQLLETAFGVGNNRYLSQLDGTIQLFDTQEQQICYCHAGENLGYARGNNLGIRIAREIWNDPYYIVSNNDLVFEKPLDLSVVERVFHAHPQVGAIGPRVVTPEGEPQSPRRWQGAFRNLVLQYWVGAIGELFGSSRRKRIWDKCCGDTVSDAPSGICDWVSGCFFFLRASAFFEAGMFDDHTFLYAEEMILAKRLAAVNSRVYFCRELEVIHAHGATTKQALAAMQMVRMAFEANCYFYRTYRKTSRLMLGFAGMSFVLFEKLYLLRSRAAGNDV